MNDSLVDELEDATSPYQPLLNEVSSPHSDVDVWAELGDHDNHKEKYLHSSQSSLKERILNGLGNGENPLNIRLLQPQVGANLRKQDMPSSGFNVFHPKGGGNVPDKFGNISNLDSFFISLYNYYYHKGLTNICISGIMNLLNLLFTIFLSTFLLGCVKWDDISQCNQIPNGCKHPFSHYVTCPSYGLGFYSMTIFFYFFLFVMYWLWSTLGFLSTLRDTFEMHSFYTNKLQISSKQLQTMSWDDVVSELIDLNNGNHGVYKTNIPKERLTAHEIASRIMRRENYLIAFLNMSVLKLNLPFQQYFSNIFFARNMEWNLHFCVLNHMFDRSFNLHSDFKHTNGLEILQKRFLIIGIINFFMVPFVLLFMIIHFFLKYSQEWHTRRNYLGPRQWSCLAMWRFREFNELPHVFDKRIAASYPLAQKYQNLFPPTASSIIARSVSFITGSIMAVLLILSLVEENVLLDTHVYSRPLLWYFTILTGLFALSRSFIPTPIDTTEKHEEVVLQLASHTHYFPKHWKGKCESLQVRDEFYGLFQYKMQIFLKECLSVIITPYLMVFSLPDCAGDVLSFIQENTQHVEGVGAICRYSLFDFKYYQESSTKDNEVVQGKMEKSFLNFKENHPNWQGSNEGENLFNKIQHYRDQQESILLEKSMASIATSNSRLFNSSIQRSPPDDIDEEMKVTTSNSVDHLEQSSLSLSQQLLQSQAIHAALGNTQQENNFYWLEKYYQDKNT